MFRTLGQTLKTGRKLLDVLNELNLAPNTECQTEIAVVSCGGDCSNEEMKHFCGQDAKEVQIVRKHKPKTNAKATLENTAICEMLRTMLPNAPLTLFITENERKDVKKTLKHALHQCDLVVCTWTVVAEVQDMHIKLAPNKKLFCVPGFPNGTKTTCAMRTDAKLTTQHVDLLFDVDGVELFALDATQALCGAPVAVCLGVGYFLRNQIVIVGPEVIGLGERVQYLPSDAFWRVANTDVCDVTVCGEVIANHIGTFLLIASHKGQELTKEVHVVKTKKLQLTYMDVDEVYKLDKPFVSSNPDIALVQRGLLRCVQVGDAVLTHVSTRDKISWPVRVRQKPKTLEVSVRLKPGDTCQLHAPANCDANWVCDNTDVAMVNENGVLLALQEGSACVRVHTCFEQCATLAVVVKS